MRLNTGLGYDVLIEQGLLDRSGMILAPYAREGRLIVVTDSNVRAALGHHFAAGLAQTGLAIEWIVLPPGESTKNWRHLIELTEQLLARGVGRSDHIVALGGGVVGDVAGFAAAILKRGCGVIQVPTTLLAMVDSAIGGKTGINAAAGKNMVGAFHQPALVIADPTFLHTLPARQLRGGYAEVVKYGLIDDAAFFAWCEGHGAALLAGDTAARLHAIATCAAAKARIVAQDERETGTRRRLLNLGHSFAHALEAEAGFSDRLLHGEAVAVGLALAFRLSAERGLCTAAEADRVRDHLELVGLPTSVAATGISASGVCLANHMRHDKKSAGGLTLILSRGIGRAFAESNVTYDDVADFLDRAA